MVVEEYDYQSNTKLSDTHECDNCYELKRSVIPKKIENQPGLSTISYRIGEYNDFKKSLLDKISQKNALKKLTSRSDRDQSISLLDAWAVVADVLTFYQERIANEAYLRTSVDPRSILELARSVGYEPKPGTSAGSYVQFNIENSPESLGKEIKIEAGTKLQSLPAQGERPQIFETAETIKARSEWNQLTHNSTEPQIICENTSVFYFNGTDTKLKLNDRLLIVTEQDNDDDKSKDIDDNNNNNNKGKTERIDKNINRKIKHANKKETENIYHLGEKYLKFSIKIIEEIEVNAKLGRTIVTAFTSEDKSTHIERQSSILTDDVLNDIIVDISRKLGKTITRESLNLSTLDQSDLAGIAIKYGWSIDDFFKMLNEEFKQKQKDLTSRTKVYAFRIRASLFGYNAPKRDLLPTDTVIGPTGDWESLNICQYYSRERRRGYNKIKIYLDNTYPRILPQSWIILESSKKEVQNLNHQVARPLFILYTQDETSTYFFGIGTKITSLAVNLEDVQFDCKDFNLRNTIVYAQSEELLLADDRPLAGNGGIVKNNSLVFDHLINGLNKGQSILISGVLADMSGDKKNQIVKISEINIAPARSYSLFTEVKFEDMIVPAMGYKVDTVTANANISYITHGESTLEESIGSGDPSRRQQEFVLKQSPLAYVPSPSEEGIMSTLEIRINGIPWREVPASSFLNLKSTDKVYMTRTDHNGKTHVIFGDPSARPPLGIENIVARYMVGGGNAGNVKENQINILVTRPLGVKSVSNPILLQSATDPEDPQSIRDNIPNMVNTSQRILSLQDFESFASSFKGISKSKAVRIWNQVDEIISLTIASDDGLPVDPESQLYKSLYASISEKKEPTTKFQLNSFLQKFFTVKLRIKIATDIVADRQRIVSNVTDVLENKFSFESMQFGQSVTKEEIIIEVQQVPGVVMVDDVSLYTLYGDKSDKVNEIDSNSAHWDAITNQISEAEFLSIQKDTIKIDLEEVMK